MFSGFQSLDLHLAVLYRGEVPLVGQGDVHRMTYSAWFIEKGTLVLIEDGRTIRAKEGDWVIAKPGYSHQDFSSDAVILSIRFVAQWSSGILFFDEGLSVVFSQESSEALNRAAHELEAVITADWDFPDFAYRPKPEAPFAELIHDRIAFLTWFSILHETLQKKGISSVELKGKDSRVILAVEYIDQLPLGGAIDFQGLKSETGLSLSRLNELFRAETQMTIRQYFDVRRIAWAKKEVARAKLSIKQVAYELGFKTSSHFTDWFKRHAGATPSDFRKMLH